MISPHCDLSVFQNFPSMTNMDSSPFIVLAQECGIIGFRSRRAIARAASTDLANIHRMPAPEGYRILVFEELSEQEEENAPGIPGGSLIFNPHDVEHRTNIGELEPGELFFWPAVFLTRGELELHGPGQSPLPGDGTFADEDEEIRRPETPRPSSRVSTPPFLTPSPLPASHTMIVETSPANGLEALQYHDNPAPHFDMSMPPCGSWESKDALLAAAQAHAAKSGYAVAVGANSGIKKKTGRFEGFLVCTAGGKKRERSSLTNEDDRQRKGRSYKCECPMSMNIRMRVDGRWYLTERVLHPEMSTHNHPAVNDATTLYQHRVLSKEDRELVINNVNMGVPTSRTTALLNRPGGELKVKHRDIYNLTAAVRREARRGLPAPEAFLAIGGGDERRVYIFRHKTGR
jgi:FAR1 DNA-binding domain-containing protein